MTNPTRMSANCKEARTSLSNNVIIVVTCYLLCSRQEVIKVDAVLGLVTPIGAQMEYDRERVSYFLDFFLRSVSLQSLKLSVSSLVMSYQLVFR